MDKYEFKFWAEKAVSGIMFPPDREKVYRELVDHLEDHYAFLREEGLDDNAARQASVEAMGDAYEIAPQLAQIHRPFWGYFLRVTRVILVIVSIITLIPFGIHVWNTDYGLPLSHWPDSNVLSMATYGEGTGRTLLHMSKPNITQKSDGYTYTLTNAVYWKNDEYDNSVFFVYIKEFHPLPWAEHGAAGEWFQAEDSLGNIYECYYEHRPDEESPVLYSWGNETSPFSYTYAMWTGTDVPEAAEWIDIRYTRDGRNLVWRIDLTGGDAV